MKTRKAIQLLAYTALIVSLFLPLRANEMVSHLGEHVRILFSPLVEWQNYQSYARMSVMEGMYDPAVRVKMWKNIGYWLPITLTCWLFLIYPVLWKFKNRSAQRCGRYFALVISIQGTGFLIHHLIYWATTNRGYYQIGWGGYLLMSAYILMSLLILFDSINNDRNRPPVV